VSLTAHHLEAAGIPTVVVGSARDIVEECGVARFLFVDFPLGNPCGKPYDVAMQSAIVGQALDLLEHAWQPHTTVQSPFVWNADDDTWRTRFMRVDDTNRAALAAMGEARRRKQAESRNRS
jgi:D-proline reductase (dithiol) PrdB